MVVRKRFDLRLQNDESIVVLNEVLHEPGTGIPNLVRVHVDRYEDIYRVGARRLIPLKQSIVSPGPALADIKVR